MQVCSGNVVVACHGMTGERQSRTMVVLRAGMSMRVLVVRPLENARLTGRAARRRRSGVVLLVRLLLRVKADQSRVGMRASIGEAGLRALFGIRAVVCMAM